MTFITGKHLPRRTILRGLGVTLGLPFLDAFVPAGKRWMGTAAAASLDPIRLICIEMVHGAAGCTDWGANEQLWAPRAVGGAFDLSPTALSTLEPFRRHLTIISDTDVRSAESI